MPVRYCRVRSITTRHASTASSVPDSPRLTDSGATRTSSRPTVAEVATRIWCAIRASVPTRSGSISSGSAVMSAWVNSWSTLVPVTPSASHGKTLPARTTRTRVVVSSTAASTSKLRRTSPLARAIAPTTAGGIVRTRPSPRPTTRDQPGDQGARPGAGQGGPEERLAVPERQHQRAERGVARAHPGDRDGGLRLALRAGEDDRTRDQRSPRPRRRRSPARSESYWMNSATPPSAISRPAALSAVRRPEAGDHGCRSRSTTSVIASTMSS